MKKKLEYLKTHYLTEFMLNRSAVFAELSAKQPIICCCGKLATRLHESECRKFNTLVDKETVNRLNYLIPTNFS